MRKERKIKEEWACSIIGQALANIRTKRDAPKVIADVERTALAVRPDLMKEFRRLVKLHLRMLEGRV